MFRRSPQQAQHALPTTPADTKMAAAVFIVDFT
jgi:hypothetical protein